MEMIVDDVKCKQLFEYNDDNYITSIKIMADRECRVVFKNMTNNKYEIKKIGINILIDGSDMKDNIAYEYSIQIYNGERFIRVSKKYYIILWKDNNILFVYNKKPINIISDKILSIGKSINKVIFDIEPCYKYIIINGTDEEREMIDILHKKLFFNIYSSLAKKEISTNDIMNYINSIPNYIKECSQKSKFTFQFCECAIPVVNVFKQAKRYTNLASLIRDAEISLESCNHLKTSIAYNYLIALIRSITDRTYLYNIKKIMEEKKDEVNLSSIDIGLYSFFNLSEYAYEYKKEFKFTEILSGNYEKYGIIFSVEINFFRIYMPILMSMITHFSSLSFHIFVVGSKDETHTCIELFNKMQNTMNDFIGKKANIFLYHVESPNFVKNKITLAACARHMFAENVIIKHEAIYIMDIDLFIKDNPVDYFNKMKKINADVIIPGPGYWPLPYPWRRYMGGNIYIYIQTKILKSF